MNYTEIVQLSTGLTILVVSAFYYFFYSFKFKFAEKKWLMPFLKNILIAFTCIGLHQISEFLSLRLENIIIYKVGLILSLSSMYFFIRSLAVLLNRNLRSYFALFIVGAVAFYIFSINMFFNAKSFYLQHNSVFVWATAWMFLFIYLHVSAINSLKILNDKSSRRGIIRYLLVTLDLSFILSALYTFYGYFKNSVNLCTDSPSIWCTFFVFQTLTFPYLMFLVSKKIKHPEKRTSKSVKLLFKHLMITSTILVILVLSFPFSLGCLSKDFVFTQFIF